MKETREQLTTKLAEEMGKLAETKKKIEDIKAQLDILDNNLPTKIGKFFFFNGLDEYSYIYVEDMTCTATQVVLYGPVIKFTKYALSHLCSTTLYKQGRMTLPHSDVDKLTEVTEEVFRSKLVILLSDRNEILLKIDKNGKD